MTTQRIWAISYLMLVVALIGLAAYTRQVDQATQECIGRVVRANIESSQMRSGAAEKRDAALVGSKRALRELIRLRVIEGIGDSPAVQDAAQDYLVQTQRFIDASAELDQAREDNPIPKFENYCQETAP